MVDVLRTCFSSGGCLNGDLSGGVYEGMLSRKSGREGVGVLK